MTRHSTLLLALLALHAGGCAGPSAERAQRERLGRAVADYRHPQPLDEVWTELRLLLAGLKLDLAGKDAEAVGQEPGIVSFIFSSARETARADCGGKVLETGYSPGGVRYRAEACPDPAGVRVVLTRITAEGANHRDGTSRRDAELELALIRRLSPEAAAILEARADPGAAP
jgi:hypothetical protein